MDFIKEPLELERALEDTFGPMTPIFRDESEWQDVKLFDVRGLNFDPIILEAVRTVFAVVNNQEGRTLLIEHPKRGWEICGGHVTISELKNKDLIEALKREVLEESGYTIQQPQLGFLAHVINKGESINKELGCPYPKNAVMATFICNAHEKVSEELLDDIQQVGFFELDEASEKVRSRNRAILAAL